MGDEFGTCELSGTVRSLPLTSIDYRELSALIKSANPRVDERLDEECD